MDKLLVGVYVFTFYGTTPLVLVAGTYYVYKNKDKLIEMTNNLIEDYQKVKTRRENNS